jgi:taurine dioxygenase
MRDIQQRSYRFIATHPIAGSLGAEISGVDLATDFDDDVMGEIRSALLDHLVIFFRDQALTPAQQIAFARRWGDIHYFPLSSGLEGYPEILEVKKTPEDEKNVGNFWHTDQMFTPKPAMVSILYAKQVPAYGGDTMFSNQYMAYDTLSDGMRRMLAGLKTVSSSAHMKRGADGKSEYGSGGTSIKVHAPVDTQMTSAHPVIRTHPETGRRALFMGTHVHNFEGMTDEESRPLIDYLMRHSTRAEATCRFRWRSGSMSIWDNRCTQHLALNDYPDETRIMHRVTIAGDAPYLA